MALASAKAPVDELVASLGAIVGPRWVRARLAERRAYEADGLPTHASVPRLAVLPGSKREVIEIVRLLAHRKLKEAVPVRSGFGTGRHDIKGNPWFSFVQTGF